MPEVPQPFESLESRLLLSTSWISHGTLTISGTPGNDLISVSLRPRQISVRVHAGKTAVRPYRSFRRAMVRRIVINARAGNDYVQLTNVSLPAFIFGGPGNDTLVGGSGPDTFLGQAGDDSLVGMGGNDLLDGGPGTNIIQGGDGQDTATYDSSPGPVQMAAQAPGWLVTAPDRTETVNSDIENIYGSPGADLLLGSDLPNVLSGLGGDDTLQAVGADDTLRGGDGNDSLLMSESAANLDGGPGTDTVDFSIRTDPLTITIDDKPGDGASGETTEVGTDIENVVGGSGDDTIEGSEAPNRLDGGGGNDILHGLGGDDTLQGSAGDDTLLADPGSDVLSGGDGTDLADYSARTAALVISIDGQANDGEADERDNVMPDIENMAGGSGNDHLIGSDLFNTIWANGGDDTIDGGWGNDTLWGGDGFDIADYSSRSSIQQLRIGEGSGIPGEKDIPQPDIEGLIGGSGDDWIQGGDSAVDNLLLGNAGNDTIIGGPGNDTLIGGPGADILGHDIIPGPGVHATDDEGNDTIYGYLTDKDDDGYVDIINDVLGSNVIYYSTSDPDEVPPPGTWTRGVR